MFFTSASSSSGIGSVREPFDLGVDLPQGLAA